MQPYFFPYLGHFSLIASVDRWYVFDITQYTPRTWMNRNRILHPHDGAQYVTVPLSNSSNSIKTSEARILDLSAARQSIVGKLCLCLPAALPGDLGGEFRAVDAVVGQ